MILKKVAGLTLKGMYNFNQKYYEQIADFMFLDIIAQLLQDYDLKVYVIINR